MRFHFIPLATVAMLLAVGPAFAEPPPNPGRFPAATDADAWAKLPPRKNPPLPEWARVLAGPLPKTTAKMLELDYLHREKNPLGPVLAAKLRGAAAVTLGSAYGEGAALADLRRAGLSDADIEAQRKKPTPAEQTAIAFAVKLTREGHAITDKEFAELLALFGPEKVTAIIHTVAYANFHNRILLGLGVRGESPPVPPVASAFDTDAKLVSPPRPPWTN